MHISRQYVKSPTRQLPCKQGAADLIEGPLGGGAPPPPIWFSAVLGAAFEAVAIVWQKGGRLRVTSVSVEDGFFFLQDLCRFVAAVRSVAVRLKIRAGGGGVLKQVYMK